MHQGFGKFTEVPETLVFGNQILTHLSMTSEKLTYRYQSVRGECIGGYMWG